MVLLRGRWFPWNPVPMPPADSVGVVEETAVEYKLFPESTFLTLLDPLPAELILPPKLVALFTNGNLGSVTIQLRVVLAATGSTVAMSRAVDFGEGTLSTPPNGLEKFQEHIGPLLRAPGVYTKHLAEGLRAYLSDLRSFFNAERLPGSPDVGLPTVRKSLAQIDQSWGLAMLILANMFRFICTNILKNTAAVGFLGAEKERYCRIKFLTKKDICGSEK